MSRTDRARRRRVVATVATAAALAVCGTALVPAGAGAVEPPGSLEVTDMGPVKSNLDRSGWRAPRDCGLSEPSPVDRGKSLWVFCDTLVTRADGSQYFLTSTAAFGPDTPGAAPDDLTEVGPSGEPAQFLPMASDLPCELSAAYTPNWSTGMARLPGTTKLLISYVSVCANASETHGRRFGIAEYDMKTRAFTNNAVVFSSANDLSPRLGLGSPVFKGKYAYFYASQCRDSWVACNAGDVFIARIALGPKRAEARSWTKPDQYRWWNGEDWVADAAAAVSIIPDAGPWSVSVDWYPKRHRFVMIEQRTIAGHIRVWESTSPLGPWKDRGVGRVPCTESETFDWFCRAVIGHPELSTSATSLGIGFYNPGTHRVQVGMLSLPK